MHVSRSQSAFLWLLHYETTPHLHNGGGGGGGSAIPWGIVNVNLPYPDRLFGQRNRGNFACGIRNLGLWNQDFSSRNPESTLRLESGIQMLLTRNPKSKFIRTRNLESSTWNAEPADWYPESKTFLDYLKWVDRGLLLQ